MFLVHFCYYYYCCCCRCYYYFFVNNGDYDFGLTFLVLFQRSNVQSFNTNFFASLSPPLQEFLAIDSRLT